MPQPATDLAERYVAMWNEQDPATRGAAIADLWAADGAQILQPPKEMLDQAARIGFINPVLEARGHRELEARVTRSYEEFVAPGEFRFRARNDARQVGDVVRFGWEMVRLGDGDPVAAGLEFLILDVQGQIRLDYQFIEP